MQRSLNVSELQQYTIVYCCTNCDKSTRFKNVLKVDNDEKWCGSSGRLRRKENWPDCFAWRALRSLCLWGASSTSRTRLHVSSS